ncbi:helix-turn-helix transcriptional regulator [Actinoplanes sichuanensis]|uniref:Helix-turn-helix domain-containing protein n=1 Tax=Actinoplanes sichuanensis TaxID=512349 RepID=A0ABW4A6Y3_9ACTN|nr:helix-turn-helix transcriptional regulator [Actinoplanes sichuanensis]BEL06077.1 helix-turn-helix transcriptional regulator [Actinoplanes sichuanensis]
MTTTENGSSVPRRQLGRKMKELRESAGLSITEAFTALEWSRQRLWRYETGQVAVHPNDVAVMGQLYGTDPQTIEGLKELARQSKAKGWWHAYSDIPEWFELFLGMEAAASRAREFAAEIIPGLLQSPQYAKEIISRGPIRLTPEAIDERVSIRMQRQRILTRPRPAAPRRETILSEAALVRGFGPELMVDQLARVVAVTELPNVSVRVIPFGAGVHSAFQGPFVILDFPRESPVRDPEPTTVYEESPTGSLYLDKPSEVDTYSFIWADLSRVALDEFESRRLIEQKMKEWSR